MEDQRAEQADIEARVRAFVADSHLLPPGGRLVVAVSGGADSLCLLGVLDALCGPGRAWPGLSLVMGHLDHGLRGEESRADAAYVAEIAAQLGLPCVLGERDVRALARQTRRGIEDAARRARYAFLREVARAEGAQRICTGHTRDDQVETLVMHWLRGSGLPGLTGMRPVAGDLARPLLCLTREQTHAYCAIRGWAPREDPTNLDRHYWRNRIRHDVLPVLLRENPNLAETLARNADLLADDEQYLEDEAARAWDQVVERQSVECVALDVAALAALAPALRRRVLRRAASSLSGGEPALEARHIALLEDLVARRGPPRTLHLPAGLMARAERDRLTLRLHASVEPAQEPHPDPDSAAPVALPVPGSVEVPGTGWRVWAELLDAAAGAPPPGAEYRRPDDARQVGTRLPPASGTAALVGRPEMRAYLDADAASQPLAVRTWRPGDRFRPLGMSHEKKLQDFFVDARVPRAARQRVPLVWGPRHLLWVAGYRLDDRVRVGPQTRRVLALRLEPAEWAGGDDDYRAEAHAAGGLPE